MPQCYLFSTVAIARPAAITEEQRMLYMKRREAQLSAQLDPFGQIAAALISTQPQVPMQIQLEFNAVG